MNYRWLMVHIKLQIDSFFHHKQKNGFTLYNSFIDLYVNPKTKVILTLIDSLILIIFYSSLTDFYYLGPYLLNLISSIKFICNSKEITSKIVNENFMDVNTLICDLIGFFNGFTRTLCQDYNCYLGCDAIYNERCFLHLRKINNDSLLVMCRERSGSNDYFQLKSLGQLKTYSRDEIQNVKEEKIEVNNDNILNFMKFKKLEKKREYLMFDYNHHKKMKNIYDEKNKRRDSKKDLLNPRFENSIISYNLDLPSESQIYDDNGEYNKENDDYENDDGEILEIFNFINRNVTGKNEEAKNNYDKQENHDVNKINNKIAKSYNIQKEQFFNDEINYPIFKNQKSHEIKNYENNNDELQMKKINQNFYRNKTVNFDHNLTLKNMELIKNINFDDLNYNDEINNNIDINKENINYKNIMKDSSINNFNRINNNYIEEEEISQVYNNKNNNFINNITSNNYGWNNYNNHQMYYPTQNITNENNINLNKEESIVPYINPFPTNNNTINNFNDLYKSQIPKQFSQNDLSFLTGYSKTENLKEDFIKINKTNPEIFSEFKEKLCYYYSLSQDNKLINISLKGYIGINIRPPNIINNKEFYINFLTDKWKDNNYFLNREFNKNLEQITENIYKISLLKQKNQIKLITYLVHQNIIAKFNIIKPQIKIFNNNLLYGFYYSKDFYEYVKKIEIILEYKNNYQIYNQISSDGNIVQNNNLKTNIIYKNIIKEGRILFPDQNIYLYIKKIIIQFILKNSILSDMKCKISFSNAINQSQETLPDKKATLLSFQYE